MEQKLTEKEFILKAIENLRTKRPDGTPKYRGIHCVYSGLNNAFREYFNSDPVTAIKKLEMEGVIVTKPVRGGVMVYKTADAPVDNGVDSVLSKILGD